MTKFGSNATNSNTIEINLEIFNLNFPCYWICQLCSWKDNSSYRSNAWVRCASGNVWDTDYISDNCEPEFLKICLAFKNDSGQPSQFLRCFFFSCSCFCFCCCFRFWRAAACSMSCHSLEELPLLPLFGTRTVKFIGRKDSSWCTSAFPPLIG